MTQVHTDDQRSATPQNVKWCRMCGAQTGDISDISESEPVRLYESDAPVGVLGSRWLCQDSIEGLSGIPRLPKPTLVELLTSLQRARIEDQHAVCDWLQRKFTSSASTTPVRRTPTST